MISGMYMKFNENIERKKQMEFRIDNIVEINRMVYRHEIISRAYRVDLSYILHDLRTETNFTIDITEGYKLINEMILQRAKEVVKNDIKDKIGVYEMQKGLNKLIGIHVVNI